MKSEEDRGHGWLVGLAYVLLMPICISLLAGWHDVPELLDRMWSEEAAGWAQVIGTVLAIVASAGFTIWHHKEVARAAARDQTIAYRNLAHIAARFVVYAHVEFLPGREREKFTKHFQVCRTALDAISFNQPLTPSLAYSYVNLVHHFDRFRSNFEEPWPEEASQQETCRRRLAESLGEITREMNTLNAVAKARGAIEKGDEVYYSPDELGGKSKTEAQVHVIKF